MDVCLYTEPHRGATYADQLRFVRHAEDCGFTGVVRADHYQAIGASEGLPGPTDAWVTIAALARETSRIRLGTLVSPVTFRLPGPLALTVAQIDQMSNGRVELGLGAGWYEKEHRSYGIPFPSLPERFEQLTEQLQIIRGLWETPVGRSFSFQGSHYQLSDSPALPKPVQKPGPRVILGGKGIRRTPELAARYADEFNALFMSVEDAALQYERVKAACARNGRSVMDRPLMLSNTFAVACGREDAEARHRASALQQPGGVVPKNVVVGPPSAVVDRIGENHVVGAGRIYLRLVDISDIEHVELIASDVLPQVKGMTSYSVRDSGGQ